MTEQRYPLGRNVNHDERSWSYRVARASVRASARWDRKVPVFDQGELGSCTGNAAVGTLGTGPNYVGLATTTVLDEAMAVSVYSAATAIDSAPGSYPPDDTGSDGLSVAKVLKARGLVSGYQHAFGIDDAFSAIQRGPLMFGTVWTEDMFKPSPSGLVVPTGPVQGGHEYSCVGYDSARELWEFVNSWGAAWGVGGHFFMSTQSVDHLLRQQGDVVLLVPASVTPPAPTPPQPTPSEAKANAKQFLDLWATQTHHGTNAQAAKAWKTYTS